MTKKFWMVYGEGKGPPRYQHATFEAARREAARLAHQNIGTKFFVLEAVGFVEADEIKWTDLRYGVKDHCYIDPRASEPAGIKLDPRFMPSSMTGVSHE